MAGEAHPVLLHQTQIWVERLRLTEEHGDSSLLNEVVAEEHLSRLVSKDASRWSVDGLTKLFCLSFLNWSVLFNPLPRIKK